MCLSAGILSIEAELRENCKRSAFIYSVYSIRCDAITLNSFQRRLGGIRKWQIIYAALVPSISPAVSSQQGVCGAVRKWEGLFSAYAILKTLVLDLTATLYRRSQHRTRSKLRADPVYEQPNSCPLTD